MLALLLMAQIAAAATSGSDVQGTDLVSVTPTAVRLNLAQRSYITVLRVWPDSSVEVASPTHQVRLAAGRRHLSLAEQPVPALRPWGYNYSKGNNGFDIHCLQRQVANAGASGRTLPKGAPFKSPEAVPGAWICNGSYGRSRPGIPSGLPQSPRTFGAHRMVVIVSAERLDLSTLVDRAGSFTGAPAGDPVRHALARQNGGWAAYFAAID